MEDEPQYTKAGTCFSNLLLIILFLCFISIFVFKKTPTESAKIVGQEVKQKTVAVAEQSKNINWGILGTVFILTFVPGLIIGLNQAKK
jgi:hypothetical protein